MKFGRIIKAAEFNPNDYPSLSNVEVNVFDLQYRKLETLQDEEEPLFEKNQNSLKEFKDFLKEAETNRIFSTANVTIQLTENFLLITFSPKKLNTNRYFSRV